MVCPTWVFLVAVRAVNSCKMSRTSPGSCDGVSLSSCCSWWAWGAGAEPARTETSRGECRIIRAVRRAC